MSAFRNKSHSSGLRILWIPGRKKHGHKGRYESTNKRITYSAKQKRNEVWSIGGSKGQEQLIRSDVADNAELSGISSVLPASCAIALNVSRPEMKLEENMLDKFDENINNEQQHHEFKHNENLIYDKRHSKQYPMQDDINSIKHIAEKSFNLEKADLDKLDGSLYNVTKENNNKRKRNKNKSSADHQFQKEEQHEKVVRCLHYTIMCCDCSIS